MWAGSLAFQKRKLFCLLEALFKSRLRSQRTLGLLRVQLWQAVERMEPSGDL